MPTDVHGSQQVVRRGCGEAFLPEHAHRVVQRFVAIEFSGSCHGVSIASYGTFSQLYTTGRESWRESLHVDTLSAPYIAAAPGVVPAGRVQTSVEPCACPPRRDGPEGRFIHNRNKAHPGRRLSEAASDLYISPQCLT
ncbi:protein of unknown function [Pararobbsia alpina]